MLLIETLGHVTHIDYLFTKLFWQHTSRYTVVRFKYFVQVPEDIEFFVYYTTTAAQIWQERGSLINASGIQRYNYGTHSVNVERRYDVDFECDVVNVCYCYEYVVHNDSEDLRQE